MGLRLNAIEYAAIGCAGLAITVVFTFSLHSLYRRRRRKHSVSSPRSPDDLAHSRNRSDDRRPARMKYPYPYPSPYDSPASTSSPTTLDPRSSPNTRSPSAFLGFGSPKPSPSPSMPRSSPHSSPFISHSKVTTTSPLSGQSTLVTPTSPSSGGKLKKPHGSPLYASSPRSKDIKGSLGTQHDGLGFGSAGIIQDPCRPESEELVMVTYEEGLAKMGLVRPTDDREPQMCAHAGPTHAKQYLPSTSSLRPPQRGSRSSGSVGTIRSEGSDLLSGAIPESALLRHTSETKSAVIDEFGPNMVPGDSTPPRSGTLSGGKKGHVMEREAAGVFTGGEEAHVRGRGRRTKKRMMETDQQSTWLPSYYHSPEANRKQRELQNEQSSLEYRQEMGGSSPSRYPAWI